MRPATSRETLDLIKKESVNAELSLLSIASFIGFILYAVTPYWFYNQSITLLSVILGVWIFTFLLIIPSKIQSYLSNRVNIALFVLICFWIPYVFILRLVGFSTSDWGNFFVYALFWFSYVAFCFYNGVLNVKNKMIIILAIIMIYAFNAIDNMRLLLLYPNGNKLINFYDVYKQYNIGGTTFAFELSLCALICQLLMLNQTKYKKIVFGAYTINLIYLFAFSGKMTSIVLFICASLAMLITWKINRFKKNERILLLIGFIITLLLSLFFLPYIFRLFGDSVASHDLSKRFYSLANFLEKMYTGNLVIDEYLVRIDLAKLSLETFISSPIFGIGKHFANQQMYGLNAVYSVGIGSHSELIDHLAVYGIVGLVSYLFIFKKYFVTLLYKCTTTINRDLYKIIIAFVVFYSILNNSFSMGVGILLFIMLPFVLDIIEEGIKSNASNNKA
ncbi:O-antigen ligase family protein [Paenibacillus sp. FSL R7-0179]|uniref:O-antigen ligase family protein n=1 Tax=Paenibacillus sp. FSL R7-0179 TaxID=2921672 RepID=UPI0030F71141